MLSQFYGQPYDHKTLRSKEPSNWDNEHKVGFFFHQLRVVSHNRASDLHVTVFSV